MRTYRMNAVMAGALYFLGTVFGVLGGVIGGEVLTSIISGNPLAGVDMLGLVAANSSQLTGGAFFTLMMGVSLVAMTVFLYPIFRKDSEELALGMLLFRGALEGAWYLVTTLGMLTLVALGNEYVASGADSAALQAVGNVAVQADGYLGDIGTVAFIIGAACLYTSFYRTRLIPRWLSGWGLVAAVPFLVYYLLHFFDIDPGLLFLVLPLALQELVMGLWLIIKGFSLDAVNELDGARALTPQPAD